MWRDFKFLIVLIYLFLPLFTFGQQEEGVIYDLKQNWVQYDVDAQSFMPAISQSGGSAISFLVDGAQFKNNKLFIKNKNQIYLFYKNVLLAELKEGDHKLTIDSLLLITGSKAPMLTLYGTEVKANLSTLIINGSFKGVSALLEKEHLRNKSFSSFFIITSILLLVGLTLIKYKSYDLFSQYANVSRAFNLTTIDETIYKGGFFVNPSVQLIGWMSISAAFVLYFFMIQLNMHFFEFDSVHRLSFFYHIIHLLIFTLVFFVLFVVRYVLILITAFIFDMSSVVNIHYATIIRLSFYLLLLLQIVITLNFFAVIPISSFFILTVVFGSLLLIIILVGFRLSFIVKHPFVQIFLYLCGTEIFLFVFVFKLVVG